MKAATPLNPTKAGVLGQTSVPKITRVLPVAALMVRLAGMNPLRQHSHLVRVQQTDIDSLEHVNNTVYLRYIEDVVTAHAVRVGMGLEHLRTLGVLPVVHRHTITYHRSALVGDELEVSTQITHFSGFRATRENQIRRSGVLLVECTTEWVWLDAARGRPKNVPEEIQRAFGLIE